MKIEPFALERYFAKYEFTARYLLSSSDCEALAMSDLLAMADDGSSQLWERLDLGYTESPGHPLLREEIARLYDGIDAEDTLVVVPEEGIFLAMNTLLEAGDHVVGTFPAYQSLYEVARAAGCEVSAWEGIENEGWRFDVEQLEEKLRPNTKLVVVNFPHNPTGYAPSREDFDALIRLVRSRGIYLFSDEMFRYLEVKEGSTLPSACEVYERAFSLFGLSKTFGLPGLRIGWVVSRDREILGRMTDLKFYTTICGSAPSEVLAIIALRNRSAIITRQLERVRRNIAVLEGFFERHGESFQWHRPVGSSICYPRILLPQGATRFCHDLVRETGIMVAPASVFHHGDEHIRIGFGRQNLPEAMGLLEDYLRRPAR